MRASVIPDLIDALLVAFAPLAEFVSDGQPLALDPGDWLMVGVDDPFKTGQTSAATSRQSWPSAQAQMRDEEGEIVCAVYCWNGDGDAKAARDAMSTILAGVQAALRVPFAVTVAGVWSLSFGGYEFYQWQDQNGAVAVAPFRIEFKARL